MAKKNATNCGFKYRFEWLGETTGYSYRLDVIPSYDDNNGVTLTVSNEFEGAIKDFEFIPFEFEKYNLGTGSAPSLKLQFDLSECSDNLADVLIEPFVTLDYETESYAVGNIFELYIKFNGISGESTFRRVYRGCQTNTIAQDFDASDYTYTVETSNICFEILRQVQTENLLERLVYSVEDYGVNEYYERAFYYSGKDYLHKTTIDTAPFNMVTWDNFSDAIESYCLGLFGVFMRNTSSTEFTMTLPLPIMYKNTVNGATNSTNGALATNEVYIAISAGDNLRLGAWQTLSEEYETLWDFVTDHAQGMLTRCSIGENTSGSFIVFQRINGNTTSANVDIETVSNAVFKPYADVLQSVEAVSIEDPSGDSIDKYTSNKKTMRSGEKYSLPILFHNCPIVPETDKFEVKQLGVNSTLYVTTQAQTVNLFYKSNIALANITLTGGKYIRINEYVDQQISDLRSISDFAGAGSITWNKGGLSDRADAAFNSGIFNIFANGLLEIFSNNNYESLCKIECEIPLYAVKTGGNIYSICLRTDTQTTFDLSVFEPKTGLFSEFPTIYMPLQCTMDKKEKCKVVLISKQIP